MSHLAVGAGSVARPRRSPAVRAAAARRGRCQVTGARPAGNRPQWLPRAPRRRTRGPGPGPAGQVTGQSDVSRGL